MDYKELKKDFYWAGVLDKDKDMVPAFSVPEIIDRFSSISIWFGLDFKEVIKVKKSSYLFSFIPIISNGISN